MHDWHVLSWTRKSAWLFAVETTKGRGDKIQANSHLHWGSMTYMSFKIKPSIQYYIWCSMKHLRFDTQESWK